jgi:peptidoglycan/xylan/chitin deacetylase (PgdA/CDA1 family)
VRQLRIAVACFVSAGLGFGIAAVVWPGRPANPAPAGRKGAVFRVETKQRLVALTFDDGPDPRWTPQVLELLRQYHAHATFFQVGKNVVAHPDLVHAVLGDGHEVADHTWDHPDLELMPAAQVGTEITQGADALRQVGAPSPKYFRPPKGLTDEAVGVLADANQYRTIFWDLCLERFVDHTPDMADAVQDMLTRVRPGSIILAHDGGIPDRTKTLQTLPMLLKGLQARGFKMVDVTQLLKAAQHVNR